METKFCQHCGSQIDKDCVVCPNCGKQVMALQGAQQAPAHQPVIVNNVINNNNVVGSHGAKNKWVAFLLCLFLGYFGAHKFYEGKILMGIIYLFTVGLFGIGWFFDCIALLLKPNPYYV